MSLNHMARSCLRRAGAPISPLLGAEPRMHPASAAN